eukprot:7615495-Alexandrium_andersonii.AAC.1
MGQVVRQARKGCRVVLATCRPAGARTYQTMPASLQHRSRPPITVGIASRVGSALSRRPLGVISAAGVPGLPR